MGSDKAALPVGSEPAAQRAGRLLSEVTEPTLEIGPGRSGLPSLQDQPPLEGPLSAIACGFHALTGSGYDGAVVVLACDLPLMTAAFLRWLADSDGDGTVIPEVGGHLQPVCARWSASHARLMVSLVATGHRSFAPLLDKPDLSIVDERHWGQVARPEIFSDTDTPADRRRLGLSDPEGTGGHTR